MFVALGIQYANCMRQIIICGLPGSIIFFDINLSHKRQDFRKQKKKVTEPSIRLFNNRQTQQMLCSDYKVSYISSIGQHVSVNPRPPPGP